jgi:hypothetical protein
MLSLIVHNDMCLHYNYVIFFSGKIEYWIGVRRSKLDRSLFVYDNGAPVNATFWAERQPNNLNEPYVASGYMRFASAYGWNDASISTQRTVLCESQPLKATLR